MEPQTSGTAQLFSGQALTNVALFKALLKIRESKSKEVKTLGQLQLARCKIVFYSVQYFKFFNLEKFSILKTLTVNLN